MHKRKRAGELMWEIRRLTATPAALVGFVNAPDEKSALEIANQR
jgi:hypothetical protein